MRNTLLCSLTLLSALTWLSADAFAADVPAPAPAAVHAAVAQVLGQGTERSYAARSRTIKALEINLSADEIQALYGFLDRKADADAATLGERNALKNDVVNALKMQQPMPADLASHLIAMFQDRSHDEVWRDYCIQHLGDIHANIQNPDEREQSCQVLWAAAAEKQGSIPGTALIALGNLCGQKNFEKPRIAAQALAMVRAPDYGEPAKITALQICAKLGETAVLPDARKLTADGSVLIRVSAMACLGMLGDKSDLALLKVAESSTDIRLKTAAQTASQRLSATRD